MTIDMEIPEWIVTHSHKCIKMLALEQWEIKFVFHDAIEGDSSIGGKIEYNYRYWLAWINLRSDIKPDDAGYQTVTHEMIHLALTGLTQAIDSIMQLVPEKLRPHSWDLWKDGNEQTVSRLDSPIATVLRELALVPDPAPSAVKAPDSGSDEANPVGGSNAP